MVLGRNAYLHQLLSAQIVIFYDSIFHNKMILLCSIKDLYSLLLCHWIFRLNIYQFTPVYTSQTFIIHSHSIKDCRNND